MRCRFCDHQLTPDMLREQGCGSCRGGCRKIHCPFCGQTNEVVPELLDKFLKSAKDKDNPE